MERTRKGKTKTARRLASHSYVRAVQRYGICLDDADQDVIVDKIQSGKCKLIERQSRNRTVWRVWHKGVVLGVVYDKRLKAIATLLPPDDPRLHPHDNEEKGE